MRRLFHALLLLGAGTLFFGCDAEIKLTPNGGGSSQTVWSGTQDFSSWDVNIQIPAEKFSSFEAGSKIQIEWHEPASAAKYKKLQLDYMASTWEELIGGEFSGGKTEGTAGVIPETSPLTYTVTADNAQKLKSHGLALMGYGVVVTKIAISAGSSSSENPPATPNPEDPVIKPNQPPAAQTGTPFEKHGKLHVSGAYLYDEHGEKYQLYGMSTHGISFEDYAYGD